MLGIRKLINYLAPPNTATEKRREYLRREAKIGASLFGPVPRGHQRDFFCLDDNTWIWNEAWEDGNGQLLNMHTRFDIHSNTIIKHQNGVQVPMSLNEIANLVHAMEQYYKLVSTQIYGQVPQAV